MRKNIKVIEILMVSFFVFSPLIVIFSTYSENTGNNHDILNEQLPKSSDIAGTDLYAEQIAAYVAGSKSIIRQSLFTNDTNIFPHFDSTDPAFYKCNILISASNGIQPDMFPSILSDNVFGSQFSISYNSFIGFLYYDSALSPKDAQKRAERALEIIQKKFELDLIMVNSTQPNFFPFVAYYPNWETYFYEITNNLPMDGYWDALDIDRLTSEAYITNHHLSTTFLLLNSLTFLEEGFNISTDQLNFNIEAIDLSYIQNMNMQDLFTQLNAIYANYEDLLGNLSEYMGYQANQTISPETFAQISQAFGSFTLSNDSHYSTLLIQYEGLPAGISKIGSNRYSFNLLDALGYSGRLLPSEKIFIALIGAFLSEIDINILCTEIIDFTPKYFNFYDYMIEQIGLLLFLANIDFDVQAIKDYSLELFWVSDGGVYRTYVRPVNLNNPNDPVNLLQQLGFQGIPYIPTGILNPIDYLSVSYEVANSEPNLKITKNLIGENASYGAFRQGSFNITATNVANVTTWGIPTPIPMNLDLFLVPALQDTFWGLIQAIYPGQYDSLEDFLNIDEDPRVFYFDTWGLGITDYYYPDITNITNLFPYSENMVGIIDLISVWPPGVDPDVLKAAFTNKNSVWNDDNWQLAPGQKISYIVANYSIVNSDSFTPFYSENFTIKTTPPKLPAMISGNTYENTTIEMALTNDTQSWVISSEEKYIDVHEVEVDFMFKNETAIDFINNTLERVSIIINITTTANLNTLNYQIFNFNTEKYQDMSQYRVSTVNNTSTFSFISRNNTLNWLFDPSAPNNYTIIFKIKCIDTAPFNISINDLDVVFYARDINAYDVLGSRVQFATTSGNAQYTRNSNTITLSTYNMASIISFANLTTYSSKCGQTNLFTLKFKNIGSDIALDINITIPIPGIIINSKNFTVRNNFLFYNLTKLAPSNEKVVSFSFYTPNTGSISRAIIFYRNPKLIQNRNSTLLMCQPNEVYFSAPVDYENRRPYLRTIEISYDSSSPTPLIGEIFNLTVNIKNSSPSGVSIPDINLTMNDQYGDLIRVDNNNLSLTNISYNQVKSFAITLEKADWKGYYYPPINYFQSSESRTIQIYKSSPIVLGKIEFTMDKSVDVNQIEVGDKITITIVIKNIGDITAKQITVDDEISFLSVEFELIAGKLVNEIKRLDAGEEMSITYEIKAKTQKLISLKEATIEYYYLSKQTTNSNDIEVKVIIPIWIQTLALLIPSSIALAFLGIFYWQTHKYKASKFELERNELSIFTLSSMASILKVEHTLRERLSEITKEQPKKQTPPKTTTSPVVKKPEPPKTTTAPTVKKPEPPKTTTTPAEKKPEPQKEMLTSDALNKWSVNQLKGYAVKNNIAIPSNAKKADIINTILNQKSSDKK